MSRLVTPPLAPLGPLGPAASAPGGGCRRLLLVLPAVLLLAAAALRALDALPAWIAGEPRHPRRFTSVDALERHVRTRLLLPVFFPDSLAWPAEAAWLAPGPMRPTAVVFLDRARTGPGLIVAQCLDGDAPIPERLLPPGRTIERTGTTVAGRPAVLVRGVTPGGAGFLELSWIHDGRRVVIRRFGGDVTELLRIARSLRRVHA
jgi:hypothetical protein